MAGVVVLEWRETTSRQAQRRTSTDRKLCSAEEFYYRPSNVTRSTPSGIAAYRSALTLDWLAAEDSRQRELVAAFETEPASPTRGIAHDCISYPRPSTGKIARLMLELLKNLEGDEGVLVPDLIQALIRSKLLVLETSIFDSEPDFEALVKTPGVMMGEPHTTFPRILAMTWMVVTDPATKKYGWCPIEKVTKYLSITKSSDIAKNMRSLDPVLARARFIMEEFIQHVTPLNMMKTSSTTATKPKTDILKADMRNLVSDESNPKVKRPARLSHGSGDTERVQHDIQNQLMRTFPPRTAPPAPSTTSTSWVTPDIFADDFSLLGASCSPNVNKLLFMLILFVL